ncbi:hypothetical protein AAMO2058_001624300 [Amorphochlora amoebiformis]
MAIWLLVVANLLVAAQDAAADSSSSTSVLPSPDSYTYNIDSMLPTVTPADITPATSLGLPAAPPFIAATDNTAGSGTCPCMASHAAENLRRFASALETSVPNLHFDATAGKMVPVMVKSDNLKKHISEDVLNRLKAQWEDLGNTIKIVDDPNMRTTWREQGERLKAIESIILDKAMKAPTDPLSARSLARFMMYLLTGHKPEGIKTPVVRKGSSLDNLEAELLDESISGGGVFGPQDPLTRTSPPESGSISESLTGELDSMLATPGMENLASASAARDIAARIQDRLTSPIMLESSTDIEKPHKGHHHSAWSRRNATYTAFQHGKRLSSSSSHHSHRRINKKVLEAATKDVVDAMREEGSKTHEEVVGNERTKGQKDPKAVKSPKPLPKKVYQPFLGSEDFRWPAALHVIVHVAQADGLAKQEKRAITMYAMTRGASIGDVTMATAGARGASAPGIGTSGRNEIKKSFKDLYDIRKEVLYYALLSALADGKLSTIEAQMIAFAGKGMRAGPKSILKVVDLVKAKLEMQDATSSVLYGLPKLAKRPGVYESLMLIEDYLPPPVDSEGAKDTASPKEGEEKEEKESKEKDETEKDAEKDAEKEGKGEDNEKKEASAEEPAS